MLVYIVVDSVVYVFRYIRLFSTLGVRLWWYTLLLDNVVHVFRCIRLFSQMGVRLCWYILLAKWVYICVGIYCC